MLLLTAVAAVRLQFNKSLSMKILFQLDPISSLNLEVDSSIALAKEACKRGYDIYYHTPSDLILQGCDVKAHIKHLTFQDEQIIQQDYGTKDLKNFDIIFIRQDPPFDVNYITNCQILALVKGPLFINNPNSIITHSEKIFAHKFSQYMPETLISNNIAKILEFLSLHQASVIKPVNLSGGQGVELIKANDASARDKINALLNLTNTPIIIQKFLPEVSYGDTRVLICCDKIIGQVLRIPPNNSITANLCSGGQEASAQLSNKQIQISNEIAKETNKNGLYFVGLDFIGEFLTEINVTSPTGIVHASRQMDLNLSSKIWDELIKKFSAHKISIQAS
ncbi:MAG: glutathione synthase [Rickettsiales bacterium]|jgi:glutathione synthase|nr:glutathione synthase [Rickettsiales bacterium]